MDQYLELISKFAQDLIQLQSQEELSWYVVEEIVARLDFEDCVIYRYDPSEKLLYQIAVHGEKLKSSRSINNPIVIPLGQGITGYVAQSKEAELLESIEQDTRYIPDLRGMKSELAVPIVHHGELFGVIDCESSHVGFFNKDHMEFLKVVAFMLGARLAQGELVKSLQQHEVDLQRALDEANRANQSKAVFLANMSHELRTPLNSIIGFSELMCNDIMGRLEPEPYRGYVRDIHSSGKFLLDMINDILDTSAVESGKQTLNIKPVALSVILKAVNACVLAGADEKGIAVNYQVETAPAMIKVDERVAKQILINLINNAIKFSEAGTKVTVTVSSEADNLTIEVQDEGTGIPQNILRKLTERYYRGSLDPWSSQEGTGLGLSIVEGLVKLHGGRMEIESQEGRGSCFSVILPQ